jgi:hypothetical protein
MTFKNLDWGNKCPFSDCSTSIEEDRYTEITSPSSLKRKVHCSEIIQTVYRRLIKEVF